jgi:hypothetical protein
MTRLVAVLVVLLGLAACTTQRETRVVAPAGSTVTTTPGAVAPSTKDTLLGVGRPAG